jgi:hypothetical protein
LFSTRIPSSLGEIRKLSRGLGIGGIFGVGKNIDHVGRLRHRAESFPAIEPPTPVDFARLGRAGKSRRQQACGARLGENRGEQLVRSDDLIGKALFVTFGEVGFHQIGRQSRDMHVERDRRRGTPLRQLFRRYHPTQDSSAQPAVLLGRDQTVEAGVFKLGVIFVGSAAFLIVLRCSCSEVRGELAGQLLNTL